MKFAALPWLIALVPALLGALALLLWSQARRRAALPRSTAVTPTSRRFTNFRTGTSLAAILLRLRNDENKRRKIFGNSWFEKIF